MGDRSVERSSRTARCSSARSLFVCTHYHYFINMRCFVAVALIVALAFAAEEANVAKTYKRLIPADVLRDFPGMCFASTLCATIEPGKTWDLSPFCGRSTCVLSEDKPPRLLELVEDCGPLPLANPKCKLDEEKTNKTAAFPGCCPVFKCEPGAKLEYPQIPTVAPVPEGAATAEEPAPTPAKAS